MGSALLALEFLSPAAGIIAGAISVPLLVALYFLKLRRRPVRVSSTMLWERAVQDLQVNAPFRWIRPSWLLLLQALVLACLSLAAARPAIDLPAVAGGRVILLIDRSGSMAAADAGEDASLTRLEEAQRRAIELVDRLDPAAQAMVVAFASGAQTISNFTGNAGDLRNAIRSIRPTDQPGDLASALKVVEAFVARGREEAGDAPPRVVLLSDGGLDRAGAGLSAAVGGASFEFVRVGPEPGTERDNLGIVALSARRDYEDPSTVRVFARLLSARAAPTDATVRLELNGDVLDIRAVPVPGAGPEGPGEAPLSFTLRDTDGGVLLLTLTRPDALPSDNAAAVVVAPPSSARILLVQPDDTPSTIDRLLVDALRTLPPRELRVVSADEYAQRTAERAFAGGFDLIVFDRVRPAELPPVPTISFGATVPIPGLSLQPTERASAPFAFWLRTHPVMRYVSLNDVRIADPMRVATPDVESSGLQTIETLASGPDGPLIVLLGRGAVGRLVLGFSLESTYWWRDLSFPVFIANAVDHLTAGDETSSARRFTTTEPITIRAPDGVGELRVTGPEGFSRTLRVDEAGGASLGVLPRAGVYRVERIPPPEGVIPVNMFSERESALATGSSVEIAGRETVARSVAGMTPTEIWSWFVAAALVLLVLEWTIYAWRIRIR